MAFKNLSNIFEENVQSLYSKYSLKTNRDGSTNLEPFIEVNPGDISKPDLGQQNRSVPNVSIEVDTRRLTAFEESPRGLQWRLNQSVLQTGNTFSETRTLDDTFVIDNVDPFVKKRRSARAASTIDITDNGFVPSPTYYSNIGAAGRLQAETSVAITNKVIAAEDNNFYQKLLKKVSIGRVQNNIITGDTSPILGVNQRPELDMDNTGLYNSFYPVQVWLGFQKNDERLGNVERIVKNVKNRNILGAIRAINRTINDISNTFDSVTDNEDPAGTRYFITGPQTAQRYIGNSDNPSIIIGLDGPEVNLQLGNKPYPKTQYTTIIPQAPTVAATATEVESGLFSQVNQYVPKEVTISKVRKVVDKITTGASAVEKYASQISIQNAGRILQNKLLGTLGNLYNGTSEENLSNNADENPAEQMMFEQGKYSLARNYRTNEQWQELLSNLDTQKSVSRGAIEKQIENAKLFGGQGYRGGVDLAVAANNIDNPREELRKQGGRYLTDPVNSLPIKSYDASVDNIPSGDIIENRKNAQSLVDLYFFDFVNKKSIPLRANIQGLTETVTPTYVENPYIGRVERNIVYTGAKRTINFSLIIHAFTEEELADIWVKINYLTGLAFPAAYTNGFMVPPLMKLTLGDMFNNQPGYIESLTYTVEDDTAWEIIPEWQVPHGIMVEVSYAVIEKSQMETNLYDPRESPGTKPLKTPFYAYGQPRATGTPDRRTYKPSQTEVLKEKIINKLPGKTGLPANTNDLLTIVNGIPQK